MKCPHCDVAFSLNEKDTEDLNLDSIYLDEDVYSTSIQATVCPECHSLIINLCKIYRWEKTATLSLLYPKKISYSTLTSKKDFNAYVPEEYIEIYQEAINTNTVSPRASATLCRYLLQMILQEHYKIKEKNLLLEIEKLENEDNISSLLKEKLQVFRHVANFGAHPNKSNKSNEIIEIEPNEVDIMFELLEELFDCAFIKPAKHKEFEKKAKEKYGYKN